MTLNDVAKTPIDFIPKSEYIIGIDNSCDDILLFSQNVNYDLFVYSFRTQTKQTEIPSLGCRLISAKMCGDYIVLTPAFSAGQIFLYHKTGATQNIFPRINCNKGYVRSAHLFNNKIYYIYPNNIISTNLDGCNYTDIKTSQKDMFIDACFTNNLCMTILRQNNTYCVDIYKNKNSQNLKALEAGFIPSSVTIVQHPNKELIEPYILALYEGCFFVIRYTVSYK